MWKSLGSSDQLTGDFYILKFKLLVYSFSESQLVKVKNVFLEVLFSIQLCSKASSPGQQSVGNVLGGTHNSISSQARTVT